TTTVGRPDPGQWREDTRGKPPLNKFVARSIGVYVQDTAEITPTVKLVGGLRFDYFKAKYWNANGSHFGRSDSLWSPRLGVLYQPDETSSYYISYGTSFNTSGDTYQFANARTANTPPEKSRNIEIGA